MLFMALVTTLKVSLLARLAQLVTHVMTLRKSPNNVTQELTKVLLVNHPAQVVVLDITPSSERKNAISPLVATSSPVPVTFLRCAHPALIASQEVVLAQRQPPITTMQLGKRLLMIAHGASIANPLVTADHKLKFLYLTVSLLQVVENTSPLLLTVLDQLGYLM
jgi:hypothetical protein